MRAANAIANHCIHSVRWAAFPHEDPHPFHNAGIIEMRAMVFDFDTPTRSHLRRIK